MCKCLLHVQDSLWCTVVLLRIRLFCVMRNICIILLITITRTWLILCFMDATSPWEIFFSRFGGRVIYKDGNMCCGVEAAFRIVDGFNQSKQPETTDNRLHYRRERPKFSINKCEMFAVCALNSFPSWVLIKTKRIVPCWNLYKVVSNTGIIWL